MGDKIKDNVNSSKLTKKACFEVESLDKGPLEWAKFQHQLQQAIYSLQQNEKDISFTRLY